ncbi:hypothetical protein ACWCQZ_15365 [Streptomyces sp. NPDC002285]
MTDLRFGAVVSALMVAVSGGAWATAPPVSASAATASGSASGAGGTACGSRGNRPVQNVRFHGNFRDDTVPDWLPRRSYPGGRPPAPDCCDPRNLEFRHNTLLTPDDPASDCAARPACAAIVERAGPGESYRRSAGLQ